MNRVALLLIAVAIALGIIALLVFALTGGGLNVFWLLGVFTVIAALAIQTIWPGDTAAPQLAVAENEPAPATTPTQRAHWAAASHLFDQDAREAS